MDDKIVQITEENFEAEVLNSQEPVAIDFYADWCGPCKIMAPVFERVSREYAGRVRFAKINVDEQKKLAISHKVMSIPTMLFYKGGAQADRVTGAVDETQLRGRLDALL